MTVGNINLGGQLGWICPKCGMALAPWMSTCPCYSTQEIRCTISPFTLDTITESKNNISSITESDEDDINE
jgi:hypothetical protein